MIELGLNRMGQLLRYTPQLWKGIHVAGTNGKGSVCAYLSAMLHASGIREGRFTSPFLIDRRDGITISQKVVEKQKFLEAEAKVLELNRKEVIQATEFEIMTAIAFEVFASEKIDIGVVEVGLGGRLDSTNIMEKKAVTVITKIGIDHQSWLGNSVEEIAREKAGIMRAGVPCVIDKSNSETVRNVLEEYAQKIGTEIILSSTDSPFFNDLEFSHLDLEPHQRDNLACAYTAFHLGYTGSVSPLHRLLPAIEQVQWPGRLQILDIECITQRKDPVLLDGAHNAQSAQVLANYVSRKIRTKEGTKNVTWVLAVSEGKDIKQILQPLLQNQDHVGVVRFNPVDRMPWVKATEPNHLLSVAYELGIDPLHCHNAESNILNILQWAATIADQGPIVIAGSLYLVSDVLRLIRDVKMKQKLDFCQQP
ncbi:putative dihydrofolate synthetase [Erysiphe neolycopersici]|uniref:Dihydrofolate synthetase n=1 Tax=Erysiphe neolycopersici TaxID=212602 RepID=A0A420HQA7_9PEZI|nr:putative dihydrofolate synthetase [Erysiphe neolycopersici]